MTRSEPWRFTVLVWNTAFDSLMCMVDAKGNAKREMSVREMAALQGVPYDYLGKIFTRLSRAGLVISTEGKGGGFRLARPAELISVLGRGACH